MAIHGTQARAIFAQNVQKEMRKMKPIDETDPDYMENDGEELLGACMERRHKPYVENYIHKVDVDDLKAGDVIFIKYNLVEYSVAYDEYIEGADGALSMIHVDTYKEGDK